MKLTAPENGKFQLRLASLERYFATIPARKTADEDNVYLLPIREFQSQLKRFDKQVTFFGVFKAGKSTLLNAILGSSLLPSRTNRATGVVTKVSYSNSRTAKVIRHSPISSQQETLVIEPDRIGQYILLDISQTVSKAPEEIEAVEIGLPLPLLKNGWCLMDTPGLLDNQALTERTYQQLEQSDLAVMVLAADKLLTQVEKEAAQRVHDLLNGNIIFILNRVGLIDSDNLAEVLDWAATSLEGLGNKLIGKSIIFATDAKQTLNAKQQTCPQQQDMESLAAFENWLQALLNSPTGERVFLLSRLGILEHHLSKAQAYFQLQLAREEENIKRLHHEALEDLKARQVKFDQSISEASLNLVRLRVELSQIGDTLIADCINQARALIYSHDPKWASVVKESILSACTAYEKEVEQKTKFALSKIQMQLPAPNLKDFTACANISITEDAATGVAGVIGGSTVLAASRWIGNTIFGVNLAEQNLNIVSKATEQSLSQLKVEVEKYLEQVDRVLDKYSKTNQPMLNISQSLEIAREAEKYYSSAFHWCHEFQNSVKNLKEEVMSWKSEFDEQWQSFTDTVQSHFQRVFQEKRGRFKSDADLGKLLNEIIKDSLNKWHDNCLYEGSWLEKLLKAEPEKGKTFDCSLKKIQIEKLLSSKSSISKLEILTVMTTITIAITILIWGQNFQNIVKYKFNAKQIFLSFGVCVIGYDLVSKQQAERRRVLIPNFSPRHKNRGQ